MRVLNFILKYAKPYRWYFWGIFFAICLVTLNNIAKPFLIKQLIDTVSGNAHNNLWMICIFYGLFELMLTAAWGLSDYCLIQYTPRLRIDITKHFMERLYAYPYTFFQNQLSGSLISKLGDIFQLTPPLIFTMISQFGYFILLMIFSIGLLAYVHLIFAIIMFCWVSLFFIINFFSMKKAMILSKDYAEEKSKILGLNADYLTNMLSVKTFTTKDYELSRLTQMKDGFIKTSNKQGFYYMCLYSIQGVFTSFYSLCIIASLLLGQYSGWVSPGDFALVVMINFYIISNVYQISHTLRDFVTNWGIVDQALSILEQSLDIKDKPNAKMLQIKQGRITFNNVKFQYKDVEALFQNKSVEIEPGQKVGLVGYSGGGKSTFVNLILRLYDVTGGSIHIDAQDIREVTQDSLRYHIAMIPQDPSLFNRSLMENIRYGRITSKDEEVIEAAKNAHAHDFIMNLPKQYDSIVGERGVKLSGGQRQRIAIARAILKNASILILDEATSQLDSLTESDIQDNLWAFMQGKTTIVIAHRLSTLLHMDRILVFDQGKIVEDGRHIELLAKEGLYKSLWDAQIGGFLPDLAA